MLYFPGPSGGGRPVVDRGGAALDRSLPRATIKQPSHLAGGVPRAPPAADPRVRAGLANVFAGSALEREFSSGLGVRPGADDPASPAHRDAAAQLTPGGREGRGGGGGGAARSPYGALVPRHYGAPRAKGGAMQRPSQMRAGAQQQRSRPTNANNMPRARFPQNFPTHSQLSSRGAPGGYSAHGESLPTGAGAGRDYGASPSYPASSSSGILARPGTTGGVGSAGLSAPVERPGVSFVGGEAGAVTSGARDEDLSAAMAELSQLQGLARGDARDSWRFEQATRPTTAPAVRAAASSGGRGAGARGGAAQVMNVDGLGAGGEADVQLLRPSTAAAGEETEEELRLRLATAESVMRKLYRKTNDLQERLSSQREGPSSPGGEGGGATSGGEQSSPNGRGGDVSSSEREQALYLLQQKEADLQQMREYTSQLAARLEHLAAEQERTNSVRPSTSAGPAAEGGGPRNDEYRERYMRMRNEYRGLLRSRTDSIRKSGRISAEKEQGVLIEQLDTALKDEAELHRKESQRLNEELYMQERKSCDWYVEKRLLQDRLQALESEISSRDQLEGQIDGKMLALFSRLKSLEDANLRLEQSNEVLRTKAGEPGEE